MTTQEQLVLKISRELILWLLPTSAFLYVYVTRFDAPLASIPHHLILVGLMTSGIILIRAINSHYFSNSAIARHTSGLILSTALLLLTIYYSLVIIGLESWGKVPSWRLLETYLFQVVPLLESMGMPANAILTIAILCFIIISGGAAKYLSHQDWVHLAAPLINRRIKIILLFGFTLAAGISAHEFTKGNWVYTGEPFSISTFPEQWRVQDHSFDAAHVAYLDSQENKARQTYSAAELTAPPNIVLFIVDALRPDHMGLFGYHRQTTPYLSQLTKHRLTLKSDQMHATCGASSCGLLSLASSRFMHQFPRHPITLQEVLRLHGYEAHMVLGGDHTNFYGLGDLYGEVDSYFDGTHNRSFYVNDDRLLTDYLERFPKWNGTPVFFQIHLMSTHPLGLRFLDPDYEPQINYSRPENHFIDHSETRRESLVNFYDNGVIQTDQLIQEIKSILSKKNYLDYALVVITADHGEALGEHGQLGHANSVREPVIRIPFALIPYGRELSFGDNTNRYINQTDIAPTLLSAIGAPIPETWRGHSLLTPIDRDFSYFRQRSENGLIDHRDPNNIWKYWHNSRSGEEFVYNLTKDPTENHNLADSIGYEKLSFWREHLSREQFHVYNTPAVPN